MSTGELPVRSAPMIAFGELFISQASPAGVAPSLRLGGHNAAQGTVSSIPFLRKRI